MTESFQVASLETEEFIKKYWNTLSDEKKQYVSGVIAGILLENSLKPKGKEK